jgi:hypothetical protein
MWIGAGVAAAAVALLAVVLLASGGGGGGEKPTPAAKTTASTAAAPAPATARASGQARVDPRPAFTVSGGRLAGMVEAGGRLWVAQPSRGRLVGLAAGKPAVTAAVGGAPADLAADARGRVWAAGTGARRLTVFDPATSRRTPVATGPRPGGVVMTGGAAWVANRGASSLTRIDAATLTPRAIALPARPQTLVAAYGRVWAVLSGGAVRAFRGDGTPDPLASPPAAGAAMGGGPSHGVWIAGAIAGGRTQLTRIDPRAEVARTSGGTKTYDAPAPPAPLPGAPRGFVAEDDAIWLAAGGAVTRLDTQGDARAVGKVTLPADAGALAQRDGGLWAAVPSSGRIYRLAP